MVHISDMEASDPQLLSVWLLFLDPSPQFPSVIIKPFFPYENVEEFNQDLLNAFHNSTGKALSKSFFNEIEKYDFSWDAYWLFDSYAYSQIMSWLSADSMFISAPNLSSPPAYNDLYAVESQNFQVLCDAFMSDSNSSSPNPDWTPLTEKHFNTDLGFVEFPDVWSKLTTPQRPLPCKVITN
ncbi:MAG: hypothetical protein JEZ06_02120 [Anaerolineaceae bacterium]|nr:hypothetical protein [Anaerolineaceae bacterium]